MSEKTYRLLFWGEILDGFDKQVAWDELARSTKMTRERLQSIQDRGKVAVLCKGLNARQAFQFQERFASVGIKTHLKEDPELVGDSPFAMEEEAPPPASLAPSGPPDPPPTAALPSRPSDRIQQKEYGFKFTGNGTEYFRIWIVNLLLTIVTLGIYGPWAKVRNKKYLYGNTYLDNLSFQYLAKPLTLLKGRLIAIALFVLLMVLQAINPLLGTLFTLLLMLGMPWAIARSLAFNARNSAYRNVRFDFQGRLGEAYGVFLLWPMLGGLTFGLLWPYALYRQQRFYVANSAFGRTPFEFNEEAVSYYKIAGLALLLLVAASFVSYLLGNLFAPLGAIGTFLTFIVIGAFITVQLGNLLFNSTNLADLYFSSTMDTPSFTALYVTNTLLMIVTLGLYYPWAKVRTLKYRAERLSLVGHSSLDRFLAGTKDQVSATGQELADAFDVEFGF